MSNLNDWKRTEEIEKSLRALEAAGFDVKQLWREHAERVKEHERGEPTDEDRRYELPEKCPRMAEHLEGGRNEELSAGRLWNGLSYSLSAGMRGLLRDKYGLTPTATVTCVWVEPWPGTRFPRRMLLRSDVHVDPRVRKHVLTEVVVDGIGTFFKLANERDTQESEARRSQLTEESLTEGRVVVLDSIDRWAVEDLSGVRVGGKVEITSVSLEKFSVVDLKTGKQATLARDEFFATLEEYEKFYAEDAEKVKRAGRSGKSQDATPALDKVMESLGLG